MSEVAERLLAGVINVWRTAKVSWRGRGTRRSQLRLYR